MSTPIVTRFAPSPTGYLHIGGARTALFNWLYARGRGGKFLLRIEDTDRERHNEAAVAAILDGLSWLGLDWDGAPVSQFENAARHRTVVEKLLAEGRAYRCYMTPEETNAARDKARAENTRFESPWRTAAPEEQPTDKAFAVRFKAPIEGETLVEDAVQGTVRFPNAALDDLILLRSAAPGEEQAPTYNLAVVVDDHDMGVTHVIRGDDHLNNAARQSQIYDALGWARPTFAHVPLIHGSDGAKLSKRHGALGVEAYRDDGFLADGLANYLLRLGWSHGDDEYIPRGKALEWFDITGVNKAPARLDLEKMRAINADHVAALSDADFLAAAGAFLFDDEESASASVKERVARAAPVLKSRSATLADTKAAAGFVLVERPLDITGKASKALRKEGAAAHLQALYELLSDADDWRAEALETLIKDYVADHDIGFGAVGQPLRAALTAGLPSPDIGQVLYILGKDEALARLADQTAKASEA
ncbi:MAG: glutamate--tRNA ligase [Pseudomonadota bacterium]